MTKQQDTNEQHEHSFTCPECGSHKFGSSGMLTTPEAISLSCHGYLPPVAGRKTPTPCRWSAPYSPEGLGQEIYARLTGKKNGEGIAVFIEETSTPENSTVDTQEQPQSETTPLSPLHPETTPLSPLHPPGKTTGEEPQDKPPFKFNYQPGIEVYQLEENPIPLKSPRPNQTTRTEPYNEYIPGKRTNILFDENKHTQPQQPTTLQPLQFKGFINRLYDVEGKTLAEIRSTFETNFHNHNPETHNKDLFEQALKAKFKKRYKDPQ